MLAIGFEKALGFHRVLVVRVNSSQFRLLRYDIGGTLLGEINSTMKQEFEDILTLQGIPGDHRRMSNAATMKLLVQQIIEAKIAKNLQELGLFLPRQVFGGENQHQHSAINAYMFMVQMRPSQQLRDIKHIYIDFTRRALSDEIAEVQGQFGDHKVSLFLIDTFTTNSPDLRCFFSKRIYNFNERRIQKFMAAKRICSSVAGAQPLPPITPTTKHKINKSFEKLAV